MTSTKSKNLTGVYSLIQGCYWMNFAAIMSYSSFFLLSKGFINTEIGMIIAVACILSAVLQPILASYADRPESLSLKKMILLLFLLQLLMSVGMLFSKNSLLIGFFYGSSIMLLQLENPFINALGMECINQGKKLNYGLARGMGSVAYALICYVLGMITSKSGAKTIPVSITIITLAIFACVVFFPFSKATDKGENRSQKQSNANPVLFFKKYKRFAWVLAGCVFIYISHILLNNFLFQIIQSKGGNSTEMGTASAIAAMAELPTLFLFGYIVKKFRCDILLRTAGVFFALKAVGSLLAPGIFSFYGVQIFQMLGWGLMTAVSVYYVNKIMKPEDAVKGQAYFTMTYTMASVIGSSLGGALIDLAGVNSMLLFASVAAALGTVIVFVSAERTSI